MLPKKQILSMFSLQIIVSVLLRATGILFGFSCVTHFDCWNDRQQEVFATFITAKTKGIAVAIPFVQFIVQLFVQ